MQRQMTAKDYMNSVTGLSALTGVGLVFLKRFDLAALAFGALAIGAAGVAWDRYSTKSGAALDIRSFQKLRLPDEEETGFIVSHVPYVFFAVVSLYADRKLRKIA